MYRNIDDRKKLIDMLGYQFKNEKLLLQALTRTSALNEGYQLVDIGDFQRLEFIGDKVLNLIISDIIFDNYPNWKEGQLTSEVSKFTNNYGPLAAIARNLQLDKFLIMGKGEERNNQARENTKILSDAFEALIGAIWIDSENDYKYLRKFITEKFRLLKLFDFNKEYEERTTKLGSEVFVERIMEETMPELLYETEYGPGISVSELLSHSKYKRMATKPLTGVAASFDNLMQELNDHEANSDEDKAGGKNDKVESSSLSYKTTTSKFN